MKNNSSASDQGENGGFCKLLREVQRGHRPIDALFEDETFRIKFAPIIKAHALKPEDREELDNDVRLRIWRYLASFTPDYTLEYGGFFAWVRTITRNRFLDTLPDPTHARVEFSADRSEDLPLIDPSIEAEGELLHEERVRELETCIAGLPKRERMACTKHVLEGLSSRETAEALTKAGYPCSHPTALKWVSNALKPYFPEAEGFSIEEIERKANKRAQAQDGKETSPLKEKLEPSKKKVAEP